MDSALEDEKCRSWAISVIVERPRDCSICWTFSKRCLRCHCMGEQPNRALKPYCRARADMPLACSICVNVRGRSMMLALIRSQTISMRFIGTGRSSASGGEASIAVAVHLYKISSIPKLAARLPSSPQAPMSLQICRNALKRPGRSCKLSSVGRSLIFSKGRLLPAIDKILSWSSSGLNAHKTMQLKSRQVSRSMSGISNALFAGMNESCCCASFDRGRLAKLRDASRPNFLLSFGLAYWNLQAA